MNYLEFFGLNKEPFSNAPDIRFYYNSAQHQKAMLRLQYAVDSMKGIAVLIGDIGTGKTTLARMMLDSLPEEEYESALLVIIHSGITADWLLKKIALQLGVEDPSDEKLKLLNQIYSQLMELDQKGKKAVVLVDEAQMLKSKELMEEFRGLSNLEVPGRKLITFVFFGLPEIEKNLQLDPPLMQRVALKYRLEPLNEESTEAYIRHRLRISGCPDQIFTPESVTQIHIFSRGIPRMINTVCDNALFEAYLLKEKEVRGEVIEEVARDLGLLEEEHGKEQVAQVEESAPLPEASAEVVEFSQGNAEASPPDIAEPEEETIEPEAEEEQIEAGEEDKDVEDLIRELEEGESESPGDEMSSAATAEPEPEPATPEEEDVLAGLGLEEDEPQEQPAAAEPPPPEPPAPKKTKAAPKKQPEETEVIDDIDQLLDRLEDN